MVTQVVRNQFSEIQIGNFCQFGVKLKKEADDHVYLTLSIVRDEFQIFINNQMVEFNYYNDSIIEVLANHGIHCYKSFDFLGSFELYKLKNVTDKSIKVEFFNFYDHIWGVQALEDQPNKSLKLSNSDELSEGYKDVKFTLEPNKGGLSVHPYSVLEPYYSVVLYRRSPDYNQPFQYKVLVNGVTLINPDNNSYIFDLTESSTSILDQLSLIIPSIVQYTNDESEEFQIESTAFDISANIKIIRYGESEYPMAGYNIETVDGDVRTLDLYLYDPIDLWSN